MYILLSSARRLLWRALRHICFVSIMASVATQLIAQNALMLSVQSGYHGGRYYRTGTNYTHADAIPLGFVLSVGSNNLHAGAEYRTYLLPPTFVFYDPYNRNERFAERYREQYIGGVLRFNSASTYEATGFIARIGGGATLAKRQIALSDGTLYSSQGYRATPEVNGAAGITLPLAPWLHLQAEATTGYLFRRKLKSPSLLPTDTDDHNRWSYGFNLGIAFTWEEY